MGVGTIGYLIKSHLNDDPSLLKDVKYIDSGKENVAFQKCSNMLRTN